MQFIKYILFFTTVHLWSQTSITVQYIDKTKLEVSQLVQVDNFDTQYYTLQNEFLQLKKSKTTSYSNVQLGNITSANAFNPLKINIFYKDFNSVIILDNRLAEITKINFNTQPSFKNISHVSTGNNNAIWIFNENTRQLELFDYLSQKTRIITLPIEGNVIDIQSDYNYCWIITSTYIYKYNYFGSLLSKTTNTGFSNLKMNGKQLFLLKENTLFYSSENLNNLQALKLPELLIKQFLVTNETLYIYDDKFLYRYQLITN